MELHLHADELEEVKCPKRDNVAMSGGRKDVKHLTEHVFFIFLLFMLLLITQLAFGVEMLMQYASTTSFVYEKF